LKSEIENSPLPAHCSTLATAPRPHKWRRRWLWLLGVSVALVMLAWVFRAPLLVGLAKAWIVDDPVTRADVIVVLDGGPETRPFAAARLYREGRAPKVLVMRHRTGPTAQLGVTAAEAELARKVLVKEGVAEADINLTDDEVASTYEESVAVRNWIGTNHVKNMIIPTDVFHTRRVRWLFRKQLKDLGVQVQVRAVPVREYKTEDWWQHEQGIAAFQTEVLKHLYYRLKY
jgi:uncharacterized SAM-binding protein YcdF (DUF218 family)